MFVKFAVKKIVAFVESQIQVGLLWIRMQKACISSPCKQVVNVLYSQGKVYGKDSDASLTAFVLIAIQDGKRICPGMIKVSKT